MAFGEKIVQPEFIPTCRKEMEAAGWSELDILLLTGDCYVDHPSFGVSIIGRHLIDSGYRVGIVAQFDWNNPEALRVMGRPKIGVGVTSGNMDSMVNIYTAGRRKRKEDMFSEDGETGKRPPHSLVVYAQLAKRAFPGIPVMIGGLEASLRRVAHYDYWQDKIRPSMLVDTKADTIYIFPFSYKVNRTISKFYIIHTIKIVTIPTFFPSFFFRC